MVWWEGGYDISAPVEPVEGLEPRMEAVEESAAVKSTRPLYVGSTQDYMNAPVYDRTKLGPGAQLTGPALVESNQTSILVPENWQLTIDQYDNCILEEVRA